MLIYAQKGDWVAQIADNLQEGLQLKLLYDLRIRLPETKEKPNHMLKGQQHKKPKRLSTASAPCIQRWKDSIRDYLRDEITEHQQGLLKITVFNTLVCQYTDINNLEKVIEQTARASHSWKHRTSGNIFDFVAIDRTPKVDGLSGIDVGRLSLIFRITIPKYVNCYELVGVQLCARVEDDECIFPVYKMTDDHSIFRTNQIARSLHMVPKWDERIINVSDDPNNVEVYDEYAKMLLNVHSDNAAWNEYYDIE